MLEAATVLEDAAKLIHHREPRPSRPEIVKSVETRAAKLEATGSMLRSVSVGRNFGAKSEAAFSMAAAADVEARGADMIVRMNAHDAKQCAATLLQATAQGMSDRKATTPLLEEEAAQETLKLAQEQAAVAAEAARIEKERVAMMEAALKHGNIAEIKALVRDIKSTDTTFQDI